MIHEGLRSYRQTLNGDRRHLLESYELVDVARKVVGVGSVGTRAWVALFEGNDADDTLILQMKEAEASVLERFCTKSVFKNHGQRVVEGQRFMQAASDIFLGWHRVPKGMDGNSHDYYFRQLWDWKVSADVDNMAPEAFLVYAKMCGWALARAHARSGDRVAIASYLGSGDTFDRAIADFAVAYADQNALDQQALVDAIKPTARFKQSLASSPQLQKDEEVDTCNFGDKWKAQIESPLVPPITGLTSCPTS